MSDGSAGVARRERVVLVTALLAISALAWWYVVRLATDMTLTMSAHALMQMAEPQTSAWRSADVLAAFVMWAVMMIAMMTPTAAPMLLTFTALERRRRTTQRAVLQSAGGSSSAATAGAAAASRAWPVASVTFLTGYLIVWLVFSLGATLLQWLLHDRGLLSSDVVRTTPLFGGILLIAAGGYQFTQLKDVCLARCRSPLDFLMTEWRDGARGALRMGLRHGRYCVGCCWLLMLVLFAAGVMSLAWVAVIALFVLLEKVVPGGARLRWPAGAALLGWGAWLIAGTL